MAGHGVNVGGFNISVGDDDSHEDLTAEILHNGRFFLSYPKIMDLINYRSTYNDHGEHVSIYPGTDMKFSDYQSLLNGIGWGG